MLAATRNLGIPGGGYQCFWHDWALHLDRSIKLNQLNWKITVDDIDPIPHAHAVHSQKRGEGLVAQFVQGSVQMCTPYTQFPVVAFFYSATEVNNNHQPLPSTMRNLDSTSINQ